MRGNPHGSHHHHHHPHTGGEPPHHHGRGGHNRGRGGHGGRHHERMERGSLRYILLDALRDGPKHGYEIIKAMEERSHGQYAPSPGTIYPTLQYLDELQLVRFHQDADRKVYAITETGLAELSDQKERVDAFWGRFAPLPSESLQHEIGFLQEELEGLSRTIWGGLQSALEREDREIFLSVRKAVERCQDEIRALIANGPAAPKTADSGG